MVPTPEKLRLSSGISPPRISQIASKSMPRFLVSLIAIRRASFELNRCRVSSLLASDNAIRSSVCDMQGAISRSFWDNSLNSFLIRFSRVAAR